MAPDPDDSHWDFDRRYERDNARERRPFHRVLDERPLANHAAVQDAAATAAGELNGPVDTDRAITYATTSDQDSAAVVIDATTGEVVKDRYGDFDFGGES